MALLEQRQAKHSEPDNRVSQREAERYRVAATNALEQLDWTIGYLHGIKKTRISAVLAHNRSYIRRELMREPDVPDPTVRTEET